MSTERKKIPYQNSRFLQQHLPACRPRFTPLVSAFFYLAISAVSLILGLVYFLYDRDVFEAIVRYDDVCGSLSTCSVNLEVDRDLSGEIFVYYELTNFYQVNYMFTTSKSWPQLEGEFVSFGNLDDCTPLVGDNGTANAPCGAVPMSLFNDTFDFDARLPQFTDSGVAISSIRDLYRPTNPQYQGQNTWLDNNPMFPGGQTNERFVNWIQTAAFPKFRKLWGRTGQDVSVTKGNYTITIQNNFPVESFDGTKSIVFAQTSWAGAKNSFLGIYFLVVFAISFILAVVFIILYVLNILPLYKAIASNSNPLQRKIVY